MSTPSRTRKLLAGTVAAATLGVGGLAVAAVNPLAVVGAQDDDATPTTTAPEGQGRRHERERPQILAEALDGLVADGALTQEQADAVRDGVRQGAEEWRAEHPGRRHGHPSHGRGHGRARPTRALRGAWEAAAEAIGVEPKALRDGRRDGRSIAEIAQEAGVERQAVIDAIVAQANERIDQAVTNGHIDAERATALKARVAERAVRLVDAKQPGG